MKKFVAETDVGSRFFSEIPPLNAEIICFIGLDVGQRTRESERREPLATTAPVDNCGCLEGGQSQPEKVVFYISVLVVSFFFVAISSFSIWPHHHLVAAASLPCLNRESGKKPSE